MDREISKPQPEEAAGEAGSSASRGRKSFSFTTGRVFLKRVLGYNDKDRSLESEREPIHNVRKSVSNSQEMECEKSFKKPEPVIDEEAEYVNKEYQDIAEEADRNPSEEAAVDDEVMGEAVRNEKEGAREDSMLYLLESPSFRVYCVHNVSVDGEIDLNQKIIN
ncbi:hypothetical protein OIU78_025931 [Salix suchowensis]|nr:hypothetical protein OIU78_025931 [Salix suchowensis]